jgi:hypothetical protein
VVIDGAMLCFDHANQVLDEKRQADQG